MKCRKGQRWAVPQYDLEIKFLEKSQSLPSPHFRSLHVSSSCIQTKGKVFQFGRWPLFVSTVFKKDGDLESRYTPLVYGLGALGILAGLSIESTDNRPSKLAEK